MGYLCAVVFRGGTVCPYSVLTGHVCLCSNLNTLVSVTLTRTSEGKQKGERSVLKFGNTCARNALLPRVCLRAAPFSR